MLSFHSILSASRSFSIDHLSYLNSAISSLSSIFIDLKFLPFHPIQYPSHPHFCPKPSARHIRNGRLVLESGCGVNLSPNLSMIRRLSPTKPVVNLITSTAKQRHRPITTTTIMADSKILIYLMRRDLRVGDNPILHSLFYRKDHGFTHLLPLYVFAAQQIEVSGFITEDGGKNPYPEARSPVGTVWRCGPHRAKFLAQSVWDLKGGLEKIGSGLSIRVGMVDEVVKVLIEGFEQAEGCKVSAVWMTSEEGVEEIREERSTKNICEKAGVDFKLWQDEKYLIDEYAPTSIIPTSRFY